MRIAPEADPRDGRLDVVVIRRRSKLHLLLVFPKVYSGRRVRDPCVELLRTEKARLTVSPSQWINADGELGRTRGAARLGGPSPEAVRVDTRS
jgi:diacylglycerol kinase family enzyme